MYCLIDFCCICFYNTKHLQPLSDSDSNNITYFIKLTSCISEMCFNEMNDQWLVCNKCCENMDAAYNFRQRCLRSKTTLTDYMSLHHVSNISGRINIYLTDINKFGCIKKEYEKENNIDKSEMFIKVNEDVNEQENFEINRISEIKRENNLFSSKLIDTEHIQFENVVIEMEQEHQFFEENVEESFANLLVNQDDNKIRKLETTIKKENDNQDFGENLHERFDNILETCDSENDDMAAKVKKSNDNPLYLEKYSDVLAANLDNIKIDIEDNDIESMNRKINIQYKSEDIDQLSTEDNGITWENENKTDQEATFFHNSQEEKQQKTSLSKKQKQQKKCGVVNQKVNIVKRYECNICNKKFPYPSFLTIHMKMHSEEKPYECKICQKKFNQSYNLKEHMKIHTGIKPHECSVCQKKFTRLSYLSDHMRIHTGEKPHECNVCHKKFNRSSNLCEHMRIHTGEKPHECDVCQAKFSQLSKMRSHMRIHTGEKPHECGVCQKNFTHSCHMKAHMKTHTGEKPYECSVCHKKFTRSSNLKEHMRIHTGEKPHECSVCHKKFTQSSKLRSHMTIHTGEKLYECDVCQKKFNQSRHLKKHIKIHTE